MKPIDFPQSTKELQRPACMSDDECGSLHVWTDGKQCISCWKPTIVERFKIMFGNNIWLGIIAGRTQPPVFLSADKDVFVNEPEHIVSKFVSNIRIIVDDLSIAWNALTEGWKQKRFRKNLYFGFCISFVIGILNPFAGFALGCISKPLSKWWHAYGRGIMELMDFVFPVIGSALAMIASSYVHNLIF